MRIILPVIVLLIFSFQAKAAGTFAVPLTVEERLGVARVNESVVAGVPLPHAAQVMSPYGLAIIDSDTNEAIDADFIVANRWGGTPEDDEKPIQWVWVTFNASVEANASKTYLLSDYRPIAPATQISLSQGETTWTIDTGAAIFEIPTQGAATFSRVVIDGVNLIDTTADQGPYYRSRDTTYYAADATGGNTVSIFRRGIYNQTLTLKLKGAHRTTSDSTDDDLDYLTFLTFTAGSSIVKISHTVQNNRPWVALENNADFRRVDAANTVYADDIGLALALEVGETPSWTLATTATGELAYHGSWSSQDAATDTISLYQDSSGNDNWDLWRNQVDAYGNTCTPRENRIPICSPTAYVSFKGFQVFRNGSTQSAYNGDKMTGFLDFSGTQGGVTIALRDVWQNFPKAFRATKSGRLELALFPQDFATAHALRVGEQKTHDALFYFHAATVSSLPSVAAAATQPLLPLAPPSWYAELSRAIPTVSTEAAAAYRFPGLTNLDTSCGKSSWSITPQEYDHYMIRHLIGPGADDDTCAESEHDYAFAGIDDAVSESEMVSWMDYGDIPIDFEGQETCGTNKSITGQYGWKYDADYGLWLQCLRTQDDSSLVSDARRQFCDHAFSASLHTADIHILHHGNQSGRGVVDFRDGGAFNHSQHNNDGRFNPHRNGIDPIVNSRYYGSSEPSCGNSGNWNGTPTSDMLFGTGALAMTYWVTGHPVAYESLKDVEAWTRYDIEAIEGYAASDSRSAGNLLNALTWIYQATGESDLLSIAKRLVQNSSVFSSALGSGALDGLAQDALVRFVDLLHQQADTSLDDFLRTAVSADVEPSNNSWDLLRADIYSWAALFLPYEHARLMTKAAAFFQAGTSYPGGEFGGQGIRTVFQIKEWVNHLREGHPFQLATYILAGGPPFIPETSLASPTNIASEQNQAPIPQLLAPTAAITGEEIFFDASISADPDGFPCTLSYMWDFGDGQIAFGPTASHTYAASGSYPVHVWASDGESTGHVQSTIRVESVNHTPTAIITLDSSLNIVGEDIALQLNGTYSSDQDGDDLTYTWEFGDGQSAQEGTVTHTYTQSGTYTIQLTVSDGATSHTTDTTITVYPYSTSPLTETFEDDVADTSLWRKYSTYSYGSDEVISVGRDNLPEFTGLIKFDLGNIPLYARIESAVLELTISGEYNGAAEKAILVQRAESSWQEGQSWSTAEPSGATWQTRDGTHAWQSAGGDALHDDNECTATPMPINCLYDTSATAAGDVLEADVTSLVQAWALGAPNHGFLLSLSEIYSFDYLYFYAHDASNAQLRPRLVVTYTPATDLVGNASPSAGIIQFGISDYTAPEWEAAIQLPVVRTATASGAASATYDIDLQSAAIDDFIVTADDLAWATGESSAKTISLTMVNDDDDEADETLHCTLSLGSGSASLGLAQSVTVTIEDDDASIEPTTYLPPSPACEPIPVSSRADGQQGTDTVSDTDDPSEDSVTGEPQSPTSQESEPDTGDAASDDDHPSSPALPVPALLSAVGGCSLVMP